MLLAIPDLLNPAELVQIRTALATASWGDGRATAGAQSGAVKRNQQLPETDPVAQALGAQILDALGRSPLFVSAALPLKTFPPLFNRYETGQGFGTHIDNAIRPVKGTAVRVRTDLSATLFLSDPDEYDGGELVIEGAFGAQAAKLPAGHLLLYPASSLHHVTPVTRGERMAAFFWVQSMVRDTENRALLFDLDQSIQTLAQRDGIADAAVVSLSGIYHNLIRRWADC